VRNFVYVRPRPFHPKRLWELVYDRFILRMPDGSEGADDDDDEEEGDDEDEDEAMDVGQGNDDGSDSGPDDNDLTPPSDAQILENRRRDPHLRRLFRSKGSFFLATRPGRMGEWSQAGAQLVLEPGSAWFCTLPADAWESGRADVDDMVRRDVARGGEWGDRRQELVFIGERLDVSALEQRLDAALLDDGEWDAWQRIMRDEGLNEEERVRKLQDVFEDGFPDWPQDGGEEEEEDDGHGHGHHGHGKAGHAHDDDREGGVCVRP
jgi:hypothetical protein